MMPRAMIACVLVLYRPDLAAFKEVIDSIRGQADTIYVVDNSDGDHAAAMPSSDSIHYIALRENVGLAAAQNIGIREALQSRHDHIWLSDQDTVYPEGFSAAMVRTLQSEQTARGQIAALAPAYFDTTKDALQPFCRHTPFSDYFLPQPGINEVAHSIASGMVIPAQALRTVGLMQEDLFIDAVDLEWCWRAKNRFGLQTLCTGDVTIRHRMGDSYVRFFGRKVGFRSPVRHYYMIRNAVHLALHSRSATVALRLEVFLKALCWTCIYPAIAPHEKRAHLRATTDGFWDGLFNRMGRHRPSSGS
nr:glycosyltransferase family 2 protein [Variovorax boronicumulans]